MRGMNWKLHHTSRKQHMKLDHGSYANLHLGAYTTFVKENKPNMQKSLELKWLIKERPHCVWYVQLTNFEGCVSFLKDGNALQFPSIFSLSALGLFWTPLSEDTFRHPLSSLSSQPGFPVPFP